MIKKDTLKRAVIETLRKAVTTLDSDMKKALNDAYDRENNPLAKAELENIINNARMAEEESIPMCQDTGLLVFYGVYNPLLKIKKGFFRRRENITSVIEGAVKEATRKIPLRPNVVDPEKDRNLGNVGMGFPEIRLKPDVSVDYFDIFVLPKGGGSENVSGMKMLRPSSAHEVLADEVVEFVKKAGAKACPPYTVSVAMGGTASSTMELAKESLLNRIDIASTGLEKGIENKINDLEIGAMGYGGCNSCLKVLVSSKGRHPASFPLGVNIQCWANRRAGIRIYDTGIFGKNKLEWLTHTDYVELKKFNSAAASMKKLTLPLKEDEVRELGAGDRVLLSGTLYLARDSGHKRMLEMDKLPVDLEGGVLYHCGPVVRKDIYGDLEFVSAGPTTSYRMSALEGPVMKKHGVRGVIGKGGMDDGVLKALSEHGAVYFSFTGGCGALFAKKVKEVKNLYWEDLGTPESLWEIEVEDLPLMVAMDSKGGNLYV